jgi:hypothetical protein
MFPVASSVAAVAVEGQQQQFDECYSLHQPFSQGFTRCLLCEVTPEDPNKYQM